MVINLKSKNKSLAASYLIDAALLLIAFLLAYFTKRGHLNIEQNFLDLLPVYYAAWLLSTFLSRKFRVIENDIFLIKLKPYFLSILLMVGIISVFLYGFKLYNLSRFIVWGSLAIFLVLEIFFLSGFYFFPRFLKKEDRKKSFTPSLIFFAIEFIILTAVYLSVYFYKRGTIEINEDYLIILIGIYLTWIYVSFTTHKFLVPQSKNYLKVIWPFIKSALIILSIVSFFIFTFRVLQYSRLVVLGAVLGFSALELLVVTFYYLYTRPHLSDEIEPSIFKAELLFEPQPIEKVVEERQLAAEKYKIPGAQIQSDILKEKLQTVYLKQHPQIYQFIDNTLDLNIDILHAEVISSGNPYNVEILPDHYLHFLLNLHEINDFRRINRYFIEVNKKLKSGAVFISRFLPLEKRRAWFAKRYPVVLADILYILDFVWRRAFPKIPFLQKIYFGLTAGRERVLSRAEALGRLYFCGFEIISLKEINENIYFIAKKVKEPLDNVTPSYSPVFKMRRSGKNDNDIFVYKFRTMYPYSEYLQSYLVEINGYTADTDKINDDFRVTTWGRFLRKYWLDELPQLINVVKGELALVGVRPISEAGLQRFNKEFLEIRKNFKPGCIPPYVALKMQNVNDYEKSERIYISEKEKHPFITDIKYLYLAVYNIFTNKIRSA